LIPHLIKQQPQQEQSYVEEYIFSSSSTYNSGTYGITTPQLVAAVSAHGRAVGNFGFAYSSPDKITQDLEETRKIIFQQAHPSPSKPQPTFVNANFFIFPSREEILTNIEKCAFENSNHTLSRRDKETYVHDYVDRCLKLENLIPLILINSKIDKERALMLEQDVLDEYQRLNQQLKRDILSAMVVQNEESLSSSSSSLPQCQFIPHHLEDQLESIWKFVKDQQADQRASTGHLNLMLSFHFGLPPLSILKEAHRLGIMVGVTVTSIREAQEVLADTSAPYVNFLIAQGKEAGGHRGNFLDDDFDTKVDPVGSAAAPHMLSTLELVQGIVSMMKVSNSMYQPSVVAAGGIMTGQDICHTLKFGADAVQMGTAFLCTEEAGTSRSYRQRLLESSKDSNRSTVLTRAFSGRAARGIANNFIEQMNLEDAKRACSNDVLPFPLQHNATSPLRKLSSRCNNAEFQSLWAGTNYWKCRALTIDAFLAVLEQEMLVYKLQHG
jgi:nitronate monooxygenase